MSDTTLRNALFLVVKQAILTCERIDNYADELCRIKEAYPEFPQCDGFGLTTNNACGFVTCPTCEVTRRVNFGLHLADSIAGADTIEMVHQRCTAKTLDSFHDHTAFTAAATRRVFSRLDGLVGMKLTASFDPDIAEWVFDRVAVTTKPNKLYAASAERGITVSGIGDFGSADVDDRLFKIFGEASRLVIAAVNTGHSPLRIIEADAAYGLPILESVEATRKLWRARGLRTHLLRLT